MSKPFKINSPFEHFVTQIKKSITFSIAGLTPFTDQKILNTSFTCIHIFNSLPDLCLDWKKISPKMWAQLKTHFYTSHFTFRVLQGTTSTHILDRTLPYNHIKQQNAIINDDTCHSFSSQLASISQKINSLTSNPSHISSYYLSTKNTHTQSVTTGVRSRFFIAV